MPNWDDIPPAVATCPAALTSTSGPDDIPGCGDEPRPSGDYQQPHLGMGCQKAGTPTG